MKTLSKLIAVVIIVAAIFFSRQAEAQTTPAKALRFGLSIEADDPLGNSSIGSNFVLGGTASLRYGVSNSFAFTFTSGAYHYFTKTIPGTSNRYASYGLIPVKAGIKEFFVPHFYFAAESGVGLEITNNGWGAKRFLLAPALGWANTRWDVGFRYEYLSDVVGSDGLVGVHLAYGF